MSHPRLILSLDGGGARAQVVLQWLQLLEEHLGVPLAQVFDMVVGVSAGAIMAGMIAAGRQLRTEVMDLNSVFADRDEKHNGLTGPKYVGGAKRRELERLFGKRRLRECQIPLGVLTCRLQDGEARSFTSFRPEDNCFTVASVVDASSAAPGYFPPVRVGSQYYMDGGVCTNNPTLVALALARQRWPAKPLAVLSLGVGPAELVDMRTEKPETFGLIRYFRTGLGSVITRVDEPFYRTVAEMVVGAGRYFRLTGSAPGELDGTSRADAQRYAREARRVWNAQVSGLKQQERVLQFIRRWTGR